MMVIIVVGYILFHHNHDNTKYFFPYLNRRLKKTLSNFILYQCFIQIFLFFFERSLLRFVSA